MSANKNTQTRFLLSENDIPTQYYNINADSPVAPAPVISPATGQPVTPDELNVLFPMELIMQEVSPTATSTFPKKCARCTSSTAPPR